MNTKTVTEAEFYWFHEELKERGVRIIRCVETSGRRGEPRTYTLIWV